MASMKSSRVNPKYKKRYRVGNWPAYERGLRARGDVTVWLRSARATGCPLATANGVWPSKDAWLRAAL